ncbi:MAG TPA: sialidase family protein [Pyrinomonadaceae bacterium]|nr:sialidase family protein [Pyrinomonadaceae bacterium]
MKRLFFHTLLFNITLALALCANASAQEKHRHQAAAASSVVRVSAAGTDASEPAVAASAARDGGVFVVWVEHLTGGASDVWLARFDANGRRPSARPVRVNPKAGQATAWRGDPPTVAVSSDGRQVYVGWMMRVAGYSATTADSAVFHLSASPDGGRTFAPPVKVRDDRTPMPHGLHSLAVAEDGRVHVAWLDERGGTPPSHAAHGATAKTSGHHMEANRQVFTAYSTDGGRTFSPSHLVARDACPCCKTSLVAGAGGRVYVSWRQVLAGDFRHIAVAASADGGQKFNAPVIVSDDRWMINGCPVSGASLALKSDGVLGIAWYTAGEAGAAGIYRSESRDGGQTFAPRSSVATGKAQGTPTLLTAAGHDAALVVWESREKGTAHPASARIEGGDGGGASNAHALAPRGELPSATLAGDGRLFVAYVSKQGTRRTVQLLRASLGDAVSTSQAELKRLRHASN